MGGQEKIVGASIVLRGSFNPAIFQPAWFGKQGLLSESESERLQIEVIHPEISSIRSDDWHMQVTTDRYLIGSENEAAFPQLRDMTVGIFRLLSHTPIRFLGVNRIAHIVLPSSQEWNDLGYRLVPKQPWEFIFPDRQTGMRRVVVEVRRDDEWSGFVQITVEPSVKATPDGVYVGVNDHYVFPEKDNFSARVVTELLEDRYFGSLREAKRIAERLVSG
jgi:hypothetical protein